MLIPALAMRGTMPLFLWLFSSQGVKMRSLGPLGLGLGLVCTFPYIIDAPTQILTHVAFDAMWPHH